MELNENELKKILYKEGIEMIEKTKKFFEEAGISVEDIKCTTECKGFYSIKLKHGNGSIHYYRNDNM